MSAWLMLCLLFIFFFSLQYL